MNKNKVAILTAAGTGIGAEAAKHLASDGFNISILSSSGKGEALAKKLGGIGVTGSNQSNDDIKKIVEETLNKWGRIDVLVNSAGHGPRSRSPSASSGSSGVRRPRSGRPSATRTGRPAGTPCPVPVRDR